MSFNETLLRGKVVVVTGGAGLLGRRFCSGIASNGGTAIIADRDIVRARAIAEEIQKSRPSGVAYAVEMDITSKTSICAAIEDLVSRFEKIDAVVNNAYPRNRNYGAKFEDVTYEDFFENVGIHLGGYFLVAQQFAAHFRHNGQGNIVNMSSIYGAIAPKFEIYSNTAMTMPVEYAAVKAGLNHLTRYMASYFKGSGIRVNSLSPGGILDGQPDAFLAGYNAHCATKGMLDPEDMVPGLVFLLSDGARHITGQNVIIDDGFTL